MSRLISPKISLWSICFLGVFCLSLFVAVVIYHAVLLPLSSIGWDEGAHLLDSLYIYSAIRNISISEATNASFAQVFYPPIYSWFVALWGLFSGLSLNAFRSWSLVAFVVCSIFLYLSAYKAALLIKLSPIHAITAGILASLMFLTAPLYWFYSSLAMLEVTGTMATLFVVFLVVCLSNAPSFSWPRWVLIGLTLAFINLLKYNYALVLFIAFLAESLIGLYLAPRSDWLNQKFWSREITRLLLLIIPFFVLLFFWIILPNRLSTYLSFLTDPNPSTFPLVSFFTHLFVFYPSSIIFDYLASPFLALAVLSGIFIFIHYAILENLRPIRIIGLFFLVNLVMATLHLNNQQERYLATTVPVLYVLGALGMLKFIQTFPQAFHRLKIFSFIAFSFIVLLVARDFVWDVGHITGIAEHLAGSPVYATADYHDAFFSFDREHWPAGPSLSETPLAVVTWIAEHSDPSKPLLYAGATNEISPPAIEFLRSLKRKQPLLADPDSWHTYALTLKISSHSILAGYDYQHINQSNTEAGLAAISNDPTWREIAQRQFTSLGVTTTIWAR